MNLTHNQVIKTSYETFLQRDRNTRKDEGLQFLFNLVFPIADRQQRATLEFCQYQIEDPECGFADSIEREMTYAGPLFVDFRLVLWGKDESDTRSIIDICEQKILFGYLPIMSDSGTFVADGVECEFGSPSIEGKILKDLYQEGLHIMSADIENTMNSLEDYNGIFPYDLLNGSPLTKAVDEFTNALQPVRHR